MKETGFKITKLLAESGLDISEATYLIISILSGVIVELGDFSLELSINEIRETVTTMKSLKEGDYGDI